ncbi:MAG: YkgJ family cysteine cluster protein [Nitrospirae bacterium]|nr:YkgJ family cysteine cluster protein [Nitrospirota bacterium]
MESIKIDNIEKGVIEPREYSRNDKIHFSCYPGIGCFTKCCSGIRINLTPYDIWRLKTRLGMTYDEFLTEYTAPASIDQTPLPIVVVKLKDDAEKSCPFLTPEGCTVYTDRPSTCRYYPVGRAHIKKHDQKEMTEFFVLVKEDHCLGHLEQKEWTIDEWRQDQGSDLYDDITRDWLEVVIKAKSLGMTEFSKRSLDLFFMVSSNLDMFRRFVFESRFLETYRLDPELVEKIRDDELELLKFSLKWLRFTMFGEGDYVIADGARVKAKERERLLGEARLAELAVREKKAEEELQKLREAREKE